MDGNFSAEHMKLKNDDDFDLTGRSSYFTALSCYRAHLQIADDKQPKSTCHEHKAVNQVHATQKHLAATGIGAITCARHGYFVPDTVVDFQKGEWQVNMDYVLFQALSKLEGMPRATVIYDIACQFSVHFGAWVLKSNYLKFSNSIQIIWGIGLFHIHGHQDVCLFRYSPDLIPGISKVDGKVLETLWSQLNEISLSRKYIQAIQALEIAEEGYRNLTENADQSLITQWIAQAEEAQTQRFADVTAMDIFDVQLQHAPTRVEMQLQLAEDPAQPSLARGVASWLSLGLKIEELQLRISGLVKQGGANPTVTERLDIDRQKTRLDNMIDDFSRKANQYLAEDILVGQGHADSDWHDVELGDEEILPLPSNIGANQCRDHGVGHLVDDELCLQQGQANDALHNIRIDLGHWSFLYHTTVRQAKHSQQKKLRAWDAVHQVNTALNVHTVIYHQCRKVMITLSGTPVLLQ
ncbi:hypothetical protein PAXRUDRAFT_20157 [Paxillus rubicundulus Ve08.2h10]|uniref:Uncharacterized protein n=1 Tax=Paxillus rubicundulus Ve08.2h10 TaxID=930991 RepID=A0A0D0DAB7_9AGAM|nr:hypothetical protein PAXRUDRAFT_20157 [Paxillus rubicundulus Ve08.2h10]